MNWKRKEEYLRERVRLNRLSLSQLENRLADLGKRRYEENDITVENDFRLTSSVYVQKTRKGGSLIFHLKSYLGLLLVWIIVRIFTV